MDMNGRGNWDDWLMWDDSSKKKNHFPGKSMAASHEFYLCGDVKRAEDYIDWFNAIRSAGPNDVITFYINSYGGDMYSALQLISCIRETEAHVLCRVEGACMSAATMIALACDSFIVSPESVWMLHNYSGGAVGKGGEMADQLEFERKWSSKFLNEIYADFLTPAEIKRMLDGKDFWMDADEVCDRLIKRAEALGQEIEVAGIDVEPEPVKKKVAKKKKVSKKK